MNDSPLFVDYRKGSVNLALYEPVRSLLTPCLKCNGEILASGVKLDKLKVKPCKWEQDRSGIWHDSENGSHCQTCFDTGRTLSTLSSGDVSFYGNGSSGTVSIGVEIKEITELLSSLISGRLQDTQMRGMVNDYDPGHRWILHYGRYRPSPVDGMIQTWKEGHAQRRAGWYTFKTKTRDKQGNWKEEAAFPYSRLESFKCCSAKEYGFDFVRVEDVIEAAQWVGVLYSTWTKPYHTHKSMQVFDKSQDVRSRLRKELTEEKVKSGKVQFHVNGKVNGNSGDSDKRLMDRAAVFSQFPSIGYERAVAAARRFPSIKAGVNATIDEWAELEIVTKGKTERVIRLGKDVASGVVKFVS